MTARLVPRTILMTADCVGGVWTYTLELARTLTATGVEVHVATMGRLPSAAQRVDAAGVPGLVLHESEYRLEWMDDPWDDVAAAGEWLLALEQQVRPDIVHLNGFAQAVLPFHAPTLVVAHSCVCSWWQAVRGADAPPAWDRYRSAVRAGLLAADGVVAPTGAMLAELQRHYDVPALGTVIPNGRDASRHRPMQKDRFVLSAGRVWDEAKNVGAVARAARGAGWPAFIAGDVAAPEAAHGAAGAAAGAEYLGALAEPALARWMGRASVYALPARYEPFGLSAVEAALAGCALVLGDIPTLREVWGNAPLWVRPDDDRGLARSICALLDDASLRGRVARDCRAVALGYTTERMRDGYLAEYRSLLLRARTAGSAAIGDPACV